ncbi:uncharacterized protein F5Z01DRAFT_185772 [Emericellopsis atlantica]|uniref:CRIB domain-containing protein n=1 Tax=Emericellopsis atlantica TaxID=2614577 RepID=A0A9P7ZIU4_9HYPO|nr:uncharacterized protein F5Z01DRAFT_185772 [Emericellopsis atlantica]KAG9252790.1 hypothetical protein F5Z01DRAFT_185772 [Emericellopsis atlantica]
MAQINGQQQQQQSSRRARRTQSRDALKTSLSVPSLARENSDFARSDPHATPDLDYMEPAMEGPPSPERLRQLSKQMKRASYLNRPRVQRQQSAGSSPRHAMDRSPWEQAFENMSLSRNPSSRSNSSGAPSELRTSRESVQILGRNLFQRGNHANNKYKRASSSHSSSNSSMYSAETSAEGFSKDSLIPTIFARRKPSRDDTAQKRLQISGPFNFQHVTHTNRHEVPDLPSGNRVDTTAEPGALKIKAQDLHHFHNASIDSIQSDFDDAPLAAPPSRPPFVPRHTAPVPGSYHAMRSAKSSDQLRTNPPRASQLLGSQPPTDFGGTEPTSFAPVPPPRLSSRQSLAPEGFSAFGPAAADRPRTSGGFRKPLPFDPSEQPEASPPPPATAHGVVPPADFEAFGVEGDGRFSHAITTPDDAAWPLACPQLSPSFDKALPDVPEEEEQHGVAGRSRLSIASNSSLRGSQSVPALRSFGSRSRPMSTQSDTLGPIAIDVKAQVDAAGASEEAPLTPASPTSGSWEDAIDYCYEHEADANFDYQWDRPSLDSARAPMQPSVQLALADGGLAEASSPKSHGNLPAVTEEDMFETTVAQAASQSQFSGQDTPAPYSHLAVSGNFSLPRGDRGGRLSQLKGVRPASYASSFHESHGFNLSPSLLIPGDFHQQMLAGRYEYHDDEILRGPYHDEVSPVEARSPLSYQQRSSTSTTNTMSSTRTDDRHVSANSAFTAMTRLTVNSSSTSLNKAAGITTEGEQMPANVLAEAQDDKNDKTDQEYTSPVNTDTVPELPQMPVVNFARKPMHRSHASESIVREDMSSFKAQDPARLRWPRARTSSLSAQVAPPVGQYALFPRSQVKGTGEHI